MRELSLTYSYIIVHIRLVCAPLQGSKGVNGQSKGVRSLMEEALWTEIEDVEEWEHYRTKFQMRLINCQFCIQCVEFNYGMKCIVSLNNIK